MFVVSQLQSAEASSNIKIPPHVTPALAYFHIPIPEYNAVFMNPSMVVGEKQEVICSASVNSGMFTSLVEAGDVKATFVGHDHVNDYCGSLLGINLCYGGGIGYHTYGYVFVAHTTPFNIDNLLRRHMLSRCIRIGILYVIAASYMFPATIVGTGPSALLVWFFLSKSLTK